MQRWQVFAPLGLALGAMTALHALQSELSPVDEPVSFYLHGPHGWLLPVALASFGAAVVGVSRDPSWSRSSRIALTAFAVGMVLTAVIPSDRWFPWEAAPTLAGLVHASAALIAPVLLFPPMWAHRGRAFVRWLLAAYVVALTASGASLMVGLLLDRAPPLIGLAERLLASVAVAWILRETGRDDRRR